MFTYMGHGHGADLVALAEKALLIDQSDRKAEDDDNRAMNKSCQK
jgi:hypothetical protein